MITTATAAQIVSSGGSGNRSMSNRCREFRFPFFESGQAIFQHVLDIEWPERRGDEHLEIRNGGMITPDSLLGPLGPVAGLELFQVEIDGFRHGASMASIISRHLLESKCREIWFFKRRQVLRAPTQPGHPAR